MTLNATYQPIKQEGNGVTISFTFDFDLVQENYLQVIREVDGEQSVVEPTEYTINYNENGGEVIFIVPPAIGEYIIIVRNVELSQLVPFKTSSGFQANVVEECFDKLTAITQQNSDSISRSLKIGVGSNIDLSLPNPDKGKTLIWNETEDGFANSTVNIDELEENLTEAVTTAAQKAIAAGQSASLAVTSATNAGTSETNAADSSAEAESWAQKAALSAGASGDWVWYPKISDRLLVGDEASGYTLAGDRTLLANTTANAKIAAAYAGGMDSTDTYNDIYIDYRRAANGWKIALEDQKEALDSLYEWLGSAYYYILCNDGTVYAPRTKNFTRFSDDAGVLGDYEGDAIRNITGNIGNIVDAAIQITPPFYIRNARNNLGGGSYSSSDVGMDISLAVPTADQNRPRSNKMFLYFRTGNQIVEPQLLVAQEVIAEVADLKNNRANRDMDNLTIEGMDIVSGLGKPSMRYVDLTPPSVANTSYWFVAPANGMYTYFAIANTANTYIQISHMFLDNGDTNPANTYRKSGIYSSTTGGQYLGVEMPVKKGSIIVIAKGSGVFTGEALRFIYAEGAQ
jgi:hypothetical protein